MATTFGPSASPMPSPTSSAVWGRRGALVGTVGLALVAAGVAANALPGRAFEPELARIIGFMALVKAAIAALAVALVWWRAASPVPVGLYALTLVVLAMMVAAPWLVLNGTALGISSLLFQGGLLALAILAFVEHRGFRAADRG